MAEQLTEESSIKQVADGSLVAELELLTVLVSELNTESDMSMKLLPEPENKNHYFNLHEDPDNHYTFLPILNRKYYNHYKKQLATFWTVEEVDLGKDRGHYTGKLNDNEREFIKNILAFFAASDGIVAENLDLNFTQELTFKEVATCLRFQGMMEDIHSEMYSLMVDNLIPEKRERHHVLNAINTIPCVGEKAKWAIKWTNRAENDIQERLVAWACVEGIQFSGSFCAIVWLGQRNLMPGLIIANQFIRRDEGAHTDTSVMLYNDLKPERRLTEARVHQIVSEALAIEKLFILESIPCAMLGMNNALMSQYLEFVSDRLLVQLGYSKIWNSANPFDFMEYISIENKTNFFEERVTEYNKASVGTLEEDRELTFTEDVDF
jgi:ribonucleoside-diphosphate reductase beta chain